MTDREELEREQAAELARLQSKTSDIKAVSLPPVWGPVGRDAYKDHTYPERPCDYCAKLYRGPAVYCSLKCALADA